MTRIEAFDAWWRGFRVGLPPDQLEVMRRVAEFAFNAGARCENQQWTESLGTDSDPVKDDLLAACELLIAAIHDSDKREVPTSMRMLSIVSGRPEFAAVDACRAAISKARGT